MSLAPTDCIFFYFAGFAAQTSLSRNLSFCEYIIPASSHCASVCREIVPAMVRAAHLAPKSLQNNDINNLLHGLGSASWVTAGCH